jgi:hypothetical protein
MKKILLLLLVIGLPLLIAVLAYLYSTQQVPTPSTLAPKIVALIEEELGVPVEVKSLKLTGLSGGSFSGLRIPASTAEHLYRDTPWLEAASGEVQVEWGGLFPPSSPKVDVNLNGVNLRLDRDESGRWNFLPGQAGKAGLEGSDGGGFEPPSTGEDRMEIHVRAENVNLELRDARYGAWNLRSTAPFDLAWKEEKDQPQEALVSATCEISGKFSDSAFADMDPLAIDLLRLLESGTRRASLNWKARVDDRQWEVSSNGRISTQFAGEDSLWSAGRFRVSGTWEEATGKAAVSTLAVERLEVDLPTWRVPLIEKLDLPWTSIPPDPAKLVLEKVEYDQPELQFHLSGIRFNQVSLSREFLPWTPLLSQPEDWRLENLAASVDVSIHTDNKTVHWDRGLIDLSGGREGRIASRGEFKKGDPSHWSVNLEISDFPVPNQIVEDATFALGRLTGEMNWGQTPLEGADVGLIGSGTATLTQGEMSAIRLLRGIEELLELEDLDRERFERFTFGFRMDKDRVAVEGLELLSRVLDMSGKGSFGPGNKVDVTVQVEPSQDLASAVKSERASGIVGGIAAATDPVTVSITGNLSSPRYRFIAGEGMKIPIGNLKIDF